MAHDPTSRSTGSHGDESGVGAATPGRSFGAVAEAYDRGRPGFPRAAVAWVTGEAPLTILELGAGTGLLTEHLVALGHDVHATDPDPRMLERLAAKLPELRVSQTAAEEIPSADASYDLVIAGDSYEWFDHDRALHEIARVLRRGGSLAIIRSVRDERIPWVKRLGNLIGHHEMGTGGGDAIEESPYFGPVEETSFKQWQVIDRASVQDLVRGLADVAGLERTGQESRIREVLTFYDDFGRGMDGMQLPWVTECLRAVVGIRPVTTRATHDPVVAAEAGEAGEGSDREDSAPVDQMPAIDPPSDDDSGMLLIDFR